MINYSNDSVRRQNRLMDQSRAMELLAGGEYGVLSMVGAQGGYGVPISYAWDGDNSIYFHCAPQGEKLEYIKRNPNVSFTIVGHTQILPQQFTTEYESVIVRGVIQEIASNDLRMAALELILDKYSPDDKARGMEYARKSFDRTAILHLSIQSVSGKTR